MFYAYLDWIGCAPGYNTVTAFLSEYFERAGRKVSIAREGFISLVNGADEDFCALIYDNNLFSRISLVPRVIHSVTLKNQRGAAFRTERYPQVYIQIYMRMVDYIFLCCCLLLNSLQKKNYKKKQLNISLLEKLKLL